MRVSILFIAVLFLSLTACQKDNKTIPSIKNEEVSLRTAPRPFKGTLHNGIVPEPGTECDCGEYFPAYGAGSGNLAHMGNVTSEIVACVINFDEGTVAGACVNLVAANGDELSLAVGPHTFLFDPNCGCLVAEATVEITGGHREV